MSSLETMLVLGVAAPLLSFLVLALFGSRIGKPWAGWVATAGIAASCLLATIVLVKWRGLEVAERPVAAVFPWATLGSVPLTFGVNLDSLTVIMFFMVSFVSACIFVFSIGYMSGHSDEIDGQSKFHRFFAYLSLFGFSMLGLVISSSLLFLFVFWELVGVCSYLLIGFYIHRQQGRRFRFHHRTDGPLGRPGDVSLRRDLCPGASRPEPRTGRARRHGPAGRPRAGRGDLSHYARP